LEDSKEVQIAIIPKITYFKNPSRRDRFVSKWRTLPIKTEELTDINTSWAGIVYSYYKS